MSKDNAAIIRVEPVYMLDDICVMIPPKYWHEPELGELVMRAIQNTQHESIHMEEKRNERQKSSQH